MNRSLLVQRWVAAESAPAGAAVVARSFGHPERGPVRCPAAPLLAAELAEAGLAVRTGHLRLTDSCRAADHDTVVFSASYREKRDVIGLAVAVRRSDARAAAAARDAVRGWAATMRTRRLITAEPGPVCGAVTAVVETLTGLAGSGPDPVYVLGTVSDRPEHRARAAALGAVRAEDGADIPDGARVLIPAHGAAPGFAAYAAGHGLRVTDRTCPLIAEAHAQVRRFAERGDTVVVITDQDRASLPALRAQAPGQVRVLHGHAAVEDLPVPDPLRLSYLPAPGIPSADSARAIAALRARHGRLPGQHPTDWCQAGSDRRAAVRAVADICDLVLLIGAPWHADTRTVERWLRDTPARVVLIGDITALRHADLGDTATLGLIPTATAPEDAVERCAEVLGGLGPAAVQVRRVSTSTVRKGAAAAARF